MEYFHIPYGIHMEYEYIHPTTATYAFLSGLHEIVTKINHIWGHKTHFNKYKRMEIIQSMLSDYNGIKR